jgi:hypothetical protein
MALNNFMKHDWLHRHFWLRVGGLTGCLVAGLGLILILAGFLWAGLVVVALGTAAAVAGLVVEIRAAMEISSSRRGFAGSFSAAQVLLATLVLVEINAFSFFYYHRFDLTGHEFTIPADIRQQLSQLRGDTTIVVHLTHNFGMLAGNIDDYDFAAEREVIERVQDLAEEFREFGPQFKVHVLDKKDKHYREKLDQLTADAPELSAAINHTSEDSVFVLAQHKVQTLGFQQIFQLDKRASASADGGRGNLVLNYQGERPFAVKVLNSDERKPRVAVCVVHPQLGTESSSEDLTLAGLKRALAARGFETRDIILKTNFRQDRATGRLTADPAVLTYDDTKYEQLEDAVSASDDNIVAVRDEIKQIDQTLKKFRNTKSLKKLRKEFFPDAEGELTEEDRQFNIKRLEAMIRGRENYVKNEENKKKLIRAEQHKIDLPEMAEQRRLVDLKAKLARKLADCDLIILPRMTIFNAARGQAIDNQIYQLDPAQVEAIKDFLKQGKPLLACFGPPTDPFGGMPRDPIHGGGSDGVETMLRELGINLGNETVLYRDERQSYMVDRRGPLLIFGAQVPVPPVEFAWQEAGRGSANRAERPTHERPNPVARSLQLTIAGIAPSSTDANLDLRLRNPRPVDSLGGSFKYDPTFLMTDPTAWKEMQPMATGESKAPSPGRDGTRQISIGVAIETALPKHWKPKEDRVRVAAIGHGGVFIGKQLSPVQERLLADTCNFLLGRDNMLNTQNETWSFPRVHLSQGAKRLWQWGLLIGLPMAFGYAGIIVLLKRSLR